MSKSNQSVFIAIDLNMECKLCLTPSELQKSHIIPEFLYKTLYVDNHKLQMLSVVPELENNLHEQKGLREKLLCKNCEQKFSQWEFYVSRLLKGGVPFTHRPDGNIIRVGDLDYRRFKLFQLSILWRAGISSLKFFENVQLGIHAEQLRKLLLAEDPGSANTYGCLLFGVKAGDGVFDALIMQPGKIRVDKHWAYRFFFGGFRWVFIVSSHRANRLLSRNFLQLNGDILLHIRDVMEMDDLRGFTHELARMGRLPRWD